MYNKLFTKILDSSIWLEDHATRIVWITLLAAMDQDGFAPFSTVQNLARRAGVTDEEAEHAVSVLEGPDRWKQEENDPGNRIERVPGGFFVIKAAEYSAIVRREEMRASVRERVRRFRESKSGCNASVTESDMDQTPVAQTVPPSEVVPVIDAGTTLREIWNTNTTSPLPRCKDLSDDRRAKCRLRLREHPAAWWKEAAEKIEASPFCRGQNDRGWKASFDWFIANADNALKAIEGKYDYQAPLRQDRSRTAGNAEALTRALSRIGGPA